jgi:hypothetical protein
MMRARVRWRRTSRLAVGLAAVSLVLAGCVSLPSGGAVRNVNSLPNSDPENQIVITPRAPGPLWNPAQIVNGFLVASGADPSDPSIARDYLSQKFSKTWRPSSAPQVIDSNPVVSQSPQEPARVTGGQTSAQVTVTSLHSETLVAAGPNEAGRLQVSPGSAHKFIFELVQVGGGNWRIDSIIEPDGKTSDSILLLKDSDFERDYLPRNLYYLANGSPHTLVPYPVYIPAQTGQLGGVQQLVDAVRTPPPTGSNWLYHAIATAFPTGTKITADQVQGSTAVVSLNGAAVGSDSDSLRQMEAQLFWTLTYAPDSPGGTGIRSVELNIGHTPSSTLLQQSDFVNWIPQGPSGPLYYQPLDQTGRPLLRAFTPSSDFGSPYTGKTGAAAKTPAFVTGDSSRVPLPAGLGHGPFTTVAVSPTLPAGFSDFAGCRGKKVYLAQLLFGNSDLETADLPDNCTSLSWDNQGDLWAAAGTDDVYVLNPTPTPELRVIPIPVAVPTQQIPPSDDFVSLKVAPDGLRVAMIVRGKNRASVYVSAITKKQHSSTVYLAQGGPVLTVGPDLVNPIALSWWDSDHLLVLERQSGVAQLYVVPLDGEKSTKVDVPPNAVSVTANGTFIAVGVPSLAGHGQPTVLASNGLEGPWIQVHPGSTPTYEG